MTLIGQWPVNNQATISFLTDKVDENGEAHEQWVTEDICLINMLVTNLPKLGLDHPIIKSEFLIGWVMYFGSFFFCEKRTKKQTKPKLLCTF